MTLHHRFLVKTTFLLLLCLLPFRAEAQQRHSDTVDDILQYAPLAASLSLRLVGVESSIPLKEALLGKCLTTIAVGGTAYILKHSVNEWRPDHSDRRSFPSGHTAVVFAGATSLHKEYGKRSAWISVGGYALATFVAIDRVAKDRHHWYDVAAGAAIGIAGTELSYYLAHRLLPSKKLSASLTPQQIYLCLSF